MHTTPHVSYLLPGWAQWLRAPLRPLFRTPEQGAEVVLYAACSPRMQGNSETGARNRTRNGANGGEGRMNTVLRHIHPVVHDQGHAGRAAHLAGRRGARAAAAAAAKAPPSQSFSLSCTMVAPPRTAAVTASSRDLGERRSVHACPHTRPHLPHFWLQAGSRPGRVRGSAGRRRQLLLPLLRVVLLRWVQHVEVVEGALHAAAQAQRRAGAQGGVQGGARGGHGGQQRSALGQLRGDGGGQRAACAGGR
ncbi:hypothetical protein TSOC_012877, partial [Tetrabaena socialis]